MQLLPVPNFLMETFCFTEYLQFPQENGMNCFMWLETHLKSLGDVFFFFFGPGVNFSMILCHMAVRVQLPVLQTTSIPSPDVHCHFSTAGPRTDVSHRVVSKGWRMSDSHYTLQKHRQDLIVLTPKRTVSQCADFFLTWTDVTSRDHGISGYHTSCGLIRNSGQ